MEHDNGDNHNWPVQRREDEPQQRLCAGEMHSLTERGSRRSGEEFTDEPRRRDVSFGEEPPLSTACSSGTDKLLSAPPSTETAAQGKIIALLVEIKEEQQRQWAVLKDLQARLPGQSSNEEEDVEDLDMDLPLRTLEQLDEMERQLEETGSALKRTPVGKEATHHQYADVVKKWLRFAPFRQGGGGRRCYRPPVEFADSEETDNSNQSSTR
ncbi:hypothetical protein F7725_024398 [Dissostichus mawsoni]|uniref:Uncharacterized protein n=1 Tax=Dissostichus mawsoni TaxID=36200 RepID=A0A7J5Y197_DISMA|nr:hypothetical protein F7725_024398 [Dissostichus mawsoni]